VVVGLRCQAGGVDGLSFVASLVHSLAWPAAAVTGVVVLRRPLVGWLAVPPRRVKVGPAGVEPEWPEQAARVVESLTAKPFPVPVDAGDTASAGLTVGDGLGADMLALIDTASPMAAVGACYQRLGKVLAEMIEDVEPGAASGLNVAELARLAHARGLINDTNLNAVEGLAVMHMLAAIDGNGGRLDRAKAREYVALTEGALYALRSQPRP
jgi:hypothetical protein